MATASIFLRTQQLTAATPGWQLITAATARASLLELGLVTAGAGVSGSIRLERPATHGTNTGVTLFNRDEPTAPACVSGVAAGWSVNPTTGGGANVLRQWTYASGIGNGIIWTFPRGLIVPVSASVILWNATANTNIEVNASIDE